MQAELIRRTVGWAVAEELIALTDTQVKLQAQRQLLTLGQDLIKQRHQLSPQDLAEKLASFSAPIGK